MYDIAIIGDGPAGLSAGINCAARNKKAVIIGRGAEHSAIYKAKRVDNYPGMYNVSGKEMMEKFVRHTVDMGVEIKKGRVLQMFDMGGYFGINVENDIYEAKSVILATGAGKSNGILGEDKYLGKGVSYCATCDGMLYRGKNVVVIGEIPEAESDAGFLGEICSKVLYLPTYGEMEKILDNVEVLNGKPEEIIGEEFVKGIKINGEIIECEGVFIIKKSVPLNSLISGLEIDKGKVVVDEQCRTNIKGIYACGDVAGGYYQVAKAVGEGLVAGLNAAKYLNE